MSSGDWRGYLLSLQVSTDKHKYVRELQEAKERVTGKGHRE
jgi:hypothetical protein